MIILIGGSSHVGKTLIAGKLVGKYHYHCTSLDHLKMGFIRSGMTHLTVNDDYEIRYWMWPFVAGMIRTAIENDQDLILEGCYIPGEWAQSFSDEELEHIRCVFIVMSEPYLRKNFGKLSEYADVVEKRLDDRLDLERLIMCSVNFRNDCIEHDFHYVEIDGEYDAGRLLAAVDSVIQDPKGTSKSQII